MAKADLISKAKELGIEVSETLTVPGLEALIKQKTESSTDSTEPEMVKVKITGPVAGKFGLSYKIGTEQTISKPLAEALEMGKCATILK